MTVRRLKTYTGSTGYVYQYYFVGKRPAIQSHAPGTEYIFDVSSDRKTTYPVSILLPVRELDAWVSAHGRSLTEAEQYAVVKMRLFQAFDEIGDMRQTGQSLRVDGISMAAAAETLGLA